MSATTSRSRAVEKGRQPPAQPARVLRRRMHSRAKPPDLRPRRTGATRCRPAFRRRARSSRAHSSSSLAMPCKSSGNSKFRCKAFWRSRSSARTRHPRRCSATPSVAARVVLPTPPFGEVRQHQRHVSAADRTPRRALASSATARAGREGRRAPRTGAKIPHRASGLDGRRPDRRAARPARGRDIRHRTAHRVGRPGAVAAARRARRPRAPAGRPVRQTPAPRTSSLPARRLPAPRRRPACRQLVAPARRAARQRLLRARPKAPVPFRRPGRRSMAGPPVCPGVGGPLPLASGLSRSACAAAVGMVIRSRARRSRAALSPCETGPWSSVAPVCTAAWCTTGQVATASATSTWGANSR